MQILSTTLEKKFCNTWGLYEIAAEIITLHDSELMHQITLTTKDDWIVGITLIVAGLLLMRYPMFRKAGMVLIETGIGYIGVESLKDCIRYLRERGLITADDQTKLEEIVVG